MDKPRIVDGPVTLAHVAERAGVSQMTASRALNGRSGVSAKTRREVVRIATQLGYRVNIAARKLSNGRSRIIATFAQPRCPVGRIKESRHPVCLSMFG